MMIARVPSHSRRFDLPGSKFSSSQPFAEARTLTDSASLQRKVCRRRCRMIVSRISLDTVFTYRECPDGNNVPAAVVRLKRPH